jgi:SAM-dependent methyltransferase
MGSIGHRIHRLAGAARNLRTRRTDAARAYWERSGGADWKGNSHWRDSQVPGWAEIWDEIGDVHRSMYERFARCRDGEATDRIVEWGVGGGANAVRFAPLAREFVAVDIAQDSLDETERQVGRVCSTPVRTVLVSLDDQSGHITDLDGNVDLFLCFYVLELVPSEAHALEIVRSAFRMLRPGGAAILQTKYQRSAPKPPPWASFSRDLANSYVVGVDEFWEHLRLTGFDVHYTELVPRNRLDRNYAYYFATKPEKMLGTRGRE